MRARFLQNLAVVLAVVVLMGSLALGVASLIGTHVAACGDVGVLRNTIVQILERGQHDLPHNSYFKGRPDDLRAAESTYAIDIAKLQQVGC